MLLQITECRQEATPAELVLGTRAVAHEAVKDLASLSSHAAVAAVHFCLTPSGCYQPLPDQTAQRAASAGFWASCSPLQGTMTCCSQGGLPAGGLQPLKLPLGHTLTQIAA